MKIPEPIRPVIIFLAGCLGALSLLPAGEPGATLKARPGPRVLNGTPFYGIDGANGSPGNFADFGRGKTLRLSHNGKPLYLIHLADSRRWQKVEFDDVYLNVGDTLSLEIVDIYPGKETSGAALTEIVLQGAH